MLLLIETLSKTVSCTLKPQWEAFLYWEVCHLKKENTEWKDTLQVGNWDTDWFLDKYFPKTYTKSVAEGLNPSDLLFPIQSLQTFYFIASSTFYSSIHMIKITTTRMVLCYNIALRLNKNARYGLHQFYAVLSNVTYLHP